jgi:isopentenyl-diphosphate Delta-isomerase
MEEKPVVLVDENDLALGTMEKHEVHRRAILHRAVSVFIFNSKGEWLLQQRAKEKYHSNSLWTNTCCTHPHPGEGNHEAANRRLKEEMGINCSLTEIFHFLYNEQLDNGYTEHELDHVYIGITDDLPSINTDEVMDYKYITIDELINDIEINPDRYTVWFRKIMTQYEQKFTGL